MQGEGSIGLGCGSVYSNSQHDLLVMLTAHKEQQVGSIVHRQYIVRSMLDDKEYEARSNRSLFIVSFFETRRRVSWLDTTPDAGNATDLMDRLLLLLSKRTP